MKSTLGATLICGLLALTVVNAFGTVDDLPRPRPPYAVGGSTHPKPTPPPPITMQAKEDRNIEFQYRDLERLFGRGFKVDTPVEFHEVILRLYVDSLNELDNCAQFLRDTHLLVEFRKCAHYTQRVAWRQIQVLKADIRVVTAEGL
ncbi:uncharacterized protein LOC120427026 [Culex pipiens pallens]|uniref:uncharacterized protein LOC120427026 n=1 Tax=Culex pipiens pallens TaxID=42434 RepID=UPI001953BC29|nr:uncharacterized protein LOC120427026 [Culex pipiens pallens]